MSDSANLESLFAAAGREPRNEARWDDVERAVRDVEQEGDHRLAQNVYDRAISLCPLPARRLGMLKAAAVLAKEELADFEAAIRYLKQAVELDPSDAKTAAALGELLDARGRPVR